MPIEISPGVADRLMEACLRQAIIRDSAVTFIWSCVIYRMAWRYSERAYRLVHLNVPHTMAESVIDLIIVREKNTKN